MPRRKLSEYRSKLMVHEALGLPYEGWEITSGNKKQTLNKVKGHKSYVVKVDQATKGRFKKGLVALDIPKSELAIVVSKYEKKGYEQFIIEPYVQHDNTGERYLCIAHDRSELHLSYSPLGGVDIESNPESIIQISIDETTDWERLAGETLLAKEQLRALVDIYMKNHLTFLEINPYVVSGNETKLLDLAVEVDDAAAFLVDGWMELDIRHAKNLTREEGVVRALDEGSVASFNLSVINPQGSIFLLLSGGGASIVVADEIYNRGYGKQLANYGEYSGNPNHHETFKYTSQVLELLLASRSPKKVLFIGGAVANFTDIAITFAGVIEAIDVYAHKLKKHHVKVYVRRGGPNQEEGLENMHRALERHDILGAVHDASTPITEAVGEALKGLKK